MFRLLLVALGFGLLSALGHAVPLPPDRPHNPRGLATDAAVQSILEETDALPPACILRQGHWPRLRAEQLAAFSGTVLARYRASYKSLADLDRQIMAHPKRFPLARAVRRTVQVLVDHAHAFPEALPGQKLPVPAGLKQKLFQDQVKVATHLEECREALVRLRKAGRNRTGDQSLRWQANYDYVMARLLARLIYLQEYNLMLGKVRKDDLPAVQTGAGGWRLVAAGKIQCTEREVLWWERERRKSLKRLLKEHPRTPWAWLARRELKVPLGLEWQVAR
jgi:hypothetical protein